MKEENERKGLNRILIMAFAVWFLSLTLVLAQLI